MCTLESWFTAKPIFVSARSLVDNSPMSRSSCVDVWLLFQRNNITSHYLWALDQMHRISDKNRQRSTVGRVHYLRPLTSSMKQKTTSNVLVLQHHLQLYRRSLCSFQDLFAASHTRGRQIHDGRWPSDIFLNKGLAKDKICASPTFCRYVLAAIWYCILYTHRCMYKYIQYT